MIKKEKLSGADCMQSTPFSFRYEPIFLQKMGYKRTSSQGIRPDVEMLGADTAIEAKSLWDSLSEDIQQLVMECAEEAREYHYQICDEQLAEYMAEMEANGAEFIEIDQTEWEAAVQPVYEKYVGEGGIDPVLVEAIQTDVEAVE